MRVFLTLFSCFLFFSCLLSVLDAQPRRSSRPSIPDIRGIDQEEGEQLIHDFRRQRMAGDFAFIFDLHHLPHRQQEAHLRGILWGTWNPYGALNRLHIQGTQTSEDFLPRGEFRRLLIQNGFQPVAWSYGGGDDDSVELLSLSEWTKPLVPPLIFTPFDLIMPFIFWDEFYYQGSSRVRGRPAHQFMFFPPEDFARDNPEIGAVRTSLDTRFNALLQVEVIDADDQVIRTLNVMNFRQVDEQWIVRSVELIDRQTRDRASFEVYGAAVGLALPEEFMLPDALEKGSNPVRQEDYFFF